MKTDTKPLVPKKVLNERLRARMAPKDKTKSHMLTVRVSPVLYEKIKKKVEETGAKSIHALVLAALEEVFA